MSAYACSNDFTLTIKNEVVSHSQLFLAVHQIEYKLPGNHEFRFMPKTVFALNAAIAFAFIGPELFFG